jgi:hypothetical protein
MITPVFAYTDESGNTGLEIFDRAQPIFYTLTLLAKEDLNLSAAGPVADWCRHLAVSELHAGELGVGRLAQIAPSICEYIMEVKPLFIVTSVEKRHMAPMKFVDTVLDSGLNEAVSGFSHWLRPLRLRLAHDILRHMSPRAERDFWAAFRRRDIAKFRDVINRVESSIAMRESDRRVRQLLGDALRWASKRPEDLLVKQSRLDAPNLVAFSGIIHGLHDMLKGTPLRVATFVHDEQNEFMKSFRAMYDLAHRFRFEQKHDLWAEWEAADTFDCPLTEQASSSAPALQIVDVLLWLLRRCLERGTTGDPGCDELLAPLLVIGVMHEFSRKQLVESLAESTARILTKTPTAKHLERGLQLRDETERARVRRMTESEQGPSESGGG